MTTQDTFATLSSLLKHVLTPYKAMIELSPILEGNPEPAEDRDSHMYTQMTSDAIIQSYQFTSVQEIHEFLCHGKDTDCEFKEKEVNRAGSPSTTSSFNYSGYFIDFTHS